MNLLVGGITRGQTITLVLLCIFLIIFIVVDIYLVLFLRRRNIRLAREISKNEEEEENGENNTPSETV